MTRAVAALAIAPLGLSVAIGAWACAAPPASAPAPPAAPRRVAPPAAASENAPPSERSPRCFAECNARMRDETKSMCRFCRSHQIGVRPEQFEAADRACSQTCEREWQACIAPCTKNEKAAEPSP